MTKKLAHTRKSGVYVIALNDGDSVDLDILLDDLGELIILLPSEQPRLSLLGAERFCQLSLINGRRWGSCYTPDVCCGCTMKNYVQLMPFPLL